MFTYNDYLAGKCTHREYYAQFVTESAKSAVASMVDIKKLAVDLANGDIHLNERYSCVKVWDKLLTPYHLKRDAIRDIKNNRASQADLVCVAKEAAKQLIETLNK